MSKKLTKKHEIFVAEYLASFDATKAALASGYSPKSAQSQGCQLLKHPKISAEIAKKTGKRLEKLDITADKVLGELAKLAFHDPRKFFDSDGRIKPITELDDNTAMAVAGIETMHKVVGDEEDGCVVFTKIKLADKGVNLERLGKHLKLFTDKAEVTGANGEALLPTVNVKFVHAGS